MIAVGYRAAAVEMSILRIPETLRRGPALWLDVQTGQEKHRGYRQRQGAVDPGWPVRKITMFRWLSSATIDEGTGKIVLTLDQSLKPHLIQLKEF